MWILSCTASVGYLSRMTQWKVCRSLALGHILFDDSQTKLALPSETSALDSGAKAKLKLGLFSYPVLQAADILLYGFALTLCFQERLLKPLGPPMYPLEKTKHSM